MRRPRFFLNTILGVVIGAAACSGDSTGPVNPAPNYGLISDLSKTVGAVLLKCDPLPYSATTSVIGKGGGTIYVGPHRLTIPKGALRGDVTITGEVIPGNNNSVRFSPEGLRFAVTATLNMSYSNCKGLLTLLPKKIVYTDELLNILSLLPSIDLSGQQRVQAQLQHFSRYAVAY